MKHLRALLFVYIVINLTNLYCNTPDECKSIWINNYKVASKGEEIYILNPYGVFVVPSGSDYIKKISYDAANKRFIDIAVIGNDLFAANTHEVYRLDRNEKKWIKLNYHNQEDVEDINFLASCSSNLLICSFDSLYISSDKGINWKSINFGFEDEVYNSLSVSGGNCYIDSDKGIFCSSDCGVNWIKLNDIGDYISVESFSYNGISHFALTHNGIYATDNSGKWNPLQSGNSKGEYNAHEFNSIVTIGRNVFVSSYDGVILSTDNGKNWQQVNNGLLCTTVEFLTSNWQKLIASTRGGRIFVSKDLGTSWTSIGIWPNAVSVAIKDSLLIAATDYGILVSDDYGNSWTEKNNGINTKDIRSVEVLSHRLYAGTDSGLFISDDNGNNWKHSVIGIENTGISSLAVGNNIILAVTDSGTLFVSKNYGIDWIETFNERVDKYRGSVYFLNGLFYLWTQNGKVYFSNDNGLTWNKFETGLYYDTFLSGNLTESLIYYITPTGKLFSDDGGAHWITLNNFSSFDLYSSISAFVISGDKFFALINGKLVFSADSCINWADVNLGRNDIYCISLAQSGNNLFVGTRDGLMLSTDNGATWSLINDRLDGEKVKHLFSKGNEIFASSLKEGIFVSNDCGKNWAHYTKCFYINSIDTMNNMILAAADSGLFISHDKGISWERLNPGINIAYYSHVAIIGNNLIVATNDSLLISTDKGHSWIQPKIDLEKKYVFSFITIGDKLFAGTNKGIFISKDFGFTWDRIGNEIAGLQLEKLISVGDSIFAIALNGEVYLSENQGAGWKKVFSQNPFNQISLFYNPDILLFSNSTRGAIVTGKDFKWKYIDIDRSYKPVYSVDYGSEKISNKYKKINNWEQVNNGLNNFRTQWITLSGSHLITGCNDNTAYLSTDYGNTWIDISKSIYYNQNYSFNSINSIFMAFHNEYIFYTGVNSAIVLNNHTFAGTKNGIVHTSDGGKTWEKVTSGLSDCEISGLAVSGGYIFAATYGGGIFRAKLSEFGINTEE